ncbi:pts system, galactitol-specific iia component [Liquorilactobacillus satsumensis DSM 16230 = JCM 12392]|uniref:Pts system, galactitol-specific iia component n=2 Tax=Lactobacillaceae TaxID=33958 RepID=A0A0R1V6R2_9LACO|nr:pts system, galactitol-specific iia component [Liquorilactobacillus satsumensis DSM 16230 = JCM 12392]
MFSKSLVNLNVCVNNADELFDFIGKDAHEKGFANENYVRGLKKREAQYPTGLIFSDIKLALPHVDSIYINKPFIYVAKNAFPLKWFQMGDSKEMEVNNFLFLGIKEPQKQVGLLSSIIASFQDKSFVDDFKKIDTSDVMVKLMINKFAQIAV